MSIVCSIWSNNTSSRSNRMSDSAASKTPNQAAIESLEQREADAMLHADLAALENFWSEQLLVNSTANIIAGKQMLLDLIRNGRLRLKFYERRTRRITEIDNLIDTAGNETSQLDSTTITDILLCSYMNVWIKNGDRKKNVRAPRRSDRTTAHSD